MLRDKVDSKQAIEDALREANKLKETPPQPIVIPDKGLVKFQKSEAQKNLNKVKNQPQTLTKQEYARQFIENARRDGFEIELNDDLEVIRATPIRKPSNDIDEVDILPSN